MGGGEGHLRSRWGEQYAILGTHPAADFDTKRMVDGLDNKYALLHRRDQREAPAQGGPEAGPSGATRGRAHGSAQAVAPGGHASLRHRGTEGDQAVQRANAHARIVTKGSSSSRIRMTCHTRAYLSTTARTADGAMEMEPGFTTARCTSRTAPRGHLPDAFLLLHGLIPLMPLYWIIPDHGRHHDLRRAVFLRAQQRSSGRTSSSGTRAKADPGAEPHDLCPLGGGALLVVPTALLHHRFHFTGSPANICACTM